MFKLNPVATIMGLTALTALLLTACSAGSGGTARATVEPQVPSESVSVPDHTNSPSADLPNPSDNAIALTELEQKWGLNVPEGEENPCPCEFGSTLMTKDQQRMAILPLFGNHAALAYSEITLGGYGQATLYLVARDRYVGDTNKSVNYEGFTYEAWLVAMGDLIDSEGSRVAASVAITGQASLSEAYRKGKLLSRYGTLSATSGIESIEAEYEGISISAADFRHQSVTLENRSDSDVDLKGWRLEGTNRRETYIFSEGTVLKAGQSLFVRGGLTGGATPSSGEILWGNHRFPWTYDGDQAILRDADERIVSHYEAPNLIEPVIIGNYTDLPITNKVANNRGVIDAIARFNTASVGGAASYRLSETKQATTSEGRKIWMLMLRPEGQVDGAFADARIDPDSGELLMLSGIGVQTGLSSTIGNAIELAGSGNDLLRRVAGDDSAEYRLNDLVEMPGYVILTMAQGEDDEYKVIHTDTEGFTTVSKTWMSRW